MSKQVIELEVDLGPILVAFVVGVVACAFWFSYDYNRDVVSFTKEGQARYHYLGLMNKWVDDPFVINISDRCWSDDSLWQVKCVVDNFLPYYNYVLRGGTEPISPSQYALAGGDCKDTSLFYASAFRRLGFEVEFHFFIPKHVSIMVSKERVVNDSKRWFYCIIDNGEYECLG